MSSDTTTFLQPGDGRYPERLARTIGFLSLPSLHTRGNLSLLDLPGVGFCGSRKATPKGIDIAVDCASQLGEAQVVVISGYAPGVDMASHRAALQSGGTTIVVLAEGIRNFRVKKEISAEWDWSRVLVISQFEPNTIWRPDRAMERNKVIVGLSAATIVIEARDSGGTLHAGMTALRAGVPLFAASFSETAESHAGNNSLLAAGAFPLKKSAQNNRAEMKHLRTAIGQYGSK
jgi:DNA processing protein